MNVCTNFHASYWTKTWRLAVVALSFLLLNVKMQAQTYPTGFSQVLVANGISNPTVMAFAPDGRIFVAQQNGQLRIIKNGTLLPTPFISLTVNSSGERGLLGIAFDPNFSTNNYIYLYYTLSSGANNRISRFTANGDVAVAGSEVVLLNLDPLSSATNHNGGTMQFGPDGKLYVGIGENANTAHAQNLDTYHGKILRINSDGSVPTGNPYASGTPQKLRVWSYGLRNPYTITFQPGTGKLFVNDVGQNAWEEINDATTGGKNFGWPTAEGSSTNPAFTNPVYFYGHGSGGGVGCAITGGTFFNPAATNYPASYIGKYFYIDYCSNWIDVLTLSGSTATRANFASSIAGNPVSIVTGTDGNLYFLSRSNSGVYKITYTGSSAPVITNQPQSISVAQGNPATFSVTATGSAPLSYQWRKGVVNISGATSATYTIPSVTTGDAGTYSVVVSNSAGNVTSNDATLTVTGANQAPTATITTPTTGATYAGGSVINFSGSATDPESGTLGASAFSWFVIFHHDTHTHPGPSAPSGVTSGSFTIPNSGETAANVFYRLYLVVTDPQGATDTAFTDILPRTSTITLNTNPQGLTVTLDGQPFTAPTTVTSVEGVLRTIGATSPQPINTALTYTFTSWSHGGAQSQTIATPVNDVSYTANFTATLRAADNPASTVNGLNYAYYQGDWNVLPNFPSLTATATGTVTNVDITPRTQNENFGFRFTGYISVPTDGVYTFYTSSDDGSKLYIGSTLVVNNDGLHSNQERSGQIGLRAGKHAIMIDFFEKTGQEVLTASYAGPGITKQAIPNATLFRNGTLQTTVLNPVADAYVRSGSFSNTNYGTSTALSSRNTTSANNTYHTYLRFDIGALSTNSTAVKLRLYGYLNNTNAPSAMVEVFDVISQTWQETTINFSNKPAAQTTVLASATISGTTRQYYEWDLTQHINSLRSAGATSVSLLVKNLTVTNSTRIVYNSKENVSNKPELRVTGASLLENPQVAVAALFETQETIPVGSAITIYPNPANEVLFIKNSDLDKDYKIEVYNINGAKVLETLLSSDATERIDISNFANGIYMIRLYNGKKLQQVKFVKQ